MYVQVIQINIIIVVIDILIVVAATQNIGCPSIMTPLKMGKTKNLIFYPLIKQYCTKGIG